MLKSLKNSKALSPVIAAIILIAVVVAVSIAATTWMGSISFSFMEIDELTVISHTWASDNTYIDLLLNKLATTILFTQKGEDAGVISPANRFTPQGSWVAHSRLGSQNLLRLLLLCFRISRKGILGPFSVTFTHPLYTLFSSFRTKLQSSFLRDHKLDISQELRCPRVRDRSFCTST